MKKGFMSQAGGGIVHTDHGESYGRIMRYFVPEFITATLLYAMPFWIDAAFVSHLKSTSTYATLGATNNLIHFIIKMAEALSVGTIILSGGFNGRKEYEQVGKTFKEAFWVSCIVGLFFASLLYFGAPFIYGWYGVPAEMVPLGVPFLRTRALGVLFTFIYMALVGFMRGIKNSKKPMQIFIAGTVIFIFLDYVLIFGKFGFPHMGLQGSAVASVVQYGFMLGWSLLYILRDPRNRKFGVQLFSQLNDMRYAGRLVMLSIPVVLDKAVVAAAYIWLCKVICPMGTCAIATFCVIKDMERFAFLPAIAFAQVITYLVSNDYGIGNWRGIESNIRKIVLIASGMVFSLLLLFSLKPEYVIRFFDKTGDFTQLAARAFPVLSVLVFFDLLQLILAGALRGAGNVRTVMNVRLVVCLFYFVPVSFFLSRLSLQSDLLKLVLVYGSYYVGSAIMSIAYIQRFRGKEWKQVNDQGNV